MSEDWKVCFNTECPGDLACPICGAELTIKNGRLRECSCISRRIARAYGMGIERGRCEQRRRYQIERKRAIEAMERQLPAKAGREAMTA